MRASFSGRRLHRPSRQRPQHRFSRPSVRVSRPRRRFGERPQSIVGSAGRCRRRSCPDGRSSFADLPGASVRFDGHECQGSHPPQCDGARMRRRTPRLPFRTRPGDRRPDTRLLPHRSPGTRLWRLTDPPSVDGQTVGRQTVSLPSTDVHSPGNSPDAVPGLLQGSFLASRRQRSHASRYCMRRRRKRSQLPAARSAAGRRYAGHERGL